MVVNEYYQMVILRLRFMIMKWNSKIIIKTINPDCEISKRNISIYKFIKIQYLNEIKA